MYQGWLVFIFACNVAFYLPGMGLTHLFIFIFFGGRKGLINLMLRLFWFGVKWFLKNNFSILRCLVRAKIMVNENHFRFHRKTLFNFLKMIYSFKNRKLFSEIILFVLARTFGIRLSEFGNGRSSEFKRHRNLTTSSHRLRMSTDQIPVKTGRNPAMVRTRPDLAKMAGIRPNLSKMAKIRPDLTGFGHWSDRIWQKWQGSGRFWMDSATDPAESVQNGWDPDGSSRIWPKSFGSDQI